MLKIYLFTHLSKKSLTEHLLLPDSVQSIDMNKVQSLPIRNSESSVVEISGKSEPMFHLD